jgi:hypothetical protein
LRWRRGVVVSPLLGVDYSGAQTPTASLKGLSVYQVEDPAVLVEVPPPPSLRNIGHGAASPND